MKKFKLMMNVGKCKYLISFHDGVKTHKDGSEFYDVTTFSNKVKLNKFIKELKKDGYVETGMFG